jgi:uncharacterized membrane protein
VRWEADVLVLILGLILFLAPHSVRIFADGWRGQMVARFGENGWKGLYSVVSLVGLVLIVWGYGMARQEPVLLWDPPTWTRHIAILLNLIAFILFAFYLVPAGRLKARIGHPMDGSVKVWAFAHLISNGTLADIVLFGAFLVWAIVDYASNRRRDRAAGTVRVAGPVRTDAIAVLVGVVIWAAILWRIHEWVIGTSPLA